MSAIAACFLKVVQLSTGGVRLIMEVPVERAMEAVQALGGFPQIGESRWVAIAPLKGEEDASASICFNDADLDRGDSDSAQTDPDRRSPRRELTEGERLRTRAVLLCKDERFQKWIVQHHGPFGCDIHEETAVMVLKDMCGIDSRSELALSIPAQAKFRELERRYREETGQATERRGG